MSKQKFKKKQVIEALTKADGLVTPAAKYLKCDPATIRNYMNRYPELHDIRKEAIEQLIDTAESKSKELIDEGDPHHIRWVMARLARNRGYGDKIEHQGSVPVTEQRPTEVKITFIGGEENSVEVEK